MAHPLSTAILCENHFGLTFDQTGTKFCQCRRLAPPSQSRLRSSIRKSRRADMPGRAEGVGCIFSRGLKSFLQYIQMVTAGGRKITGNYQGAVFGRTGIFSARNRETLFPDQGISTAKREGLREVFRQFRAYLSAYPCVSPAMADFRTQLRVMRTTTSTRAICVPSGGAGTPETAIVPAGMSVSAPSSSS